MPRKSTRTSAPPKPPPSSQKRKAASSRRRKRSPRYLTAEGIISAWDQSSIKEREGWLNRPRLHTAIFEQVEKDKEQIIIARKFGARFDEATKEQMQQRSRLILKTAEQFSWT